MSPSEDRLVERIGKLLAQAEGTDNEHEAAAFVERAQALATANAVDLERARRRQSDARRRGPEPLVQEKVVVGERGRRGNRHRVLLYHAVAVANDVRLNVATDSTYVLAFGHRSDLEVVERLWTSLSLQMIAAAQRRLDRGEHRLHAVASLPWRLSFYDGFTHEVRGRLASARERALAQDAQAQEARAQARTRDAGAGSTEPSAALVLRDKGERVAAFYAEQSRARGSWRGAGSGRSQVSGAAQQAGQQDGARADLGAPRIGARGRLTG